MILHVLIAMVAGWLQRHQPQVITYLLAENRVLKAQLSGRRLHLTDTERRHLFDRTVLDAPLVKHLLRPLQLGPGCHVEREAVEPAGSQIAPRHASAGDGPQAEQHPVVGHDHPAQLRLPALALARRYRVVLDLETEHLRLELLRALDVARGR